MRHLFGGIYFAEETPENTVCLSDRGYHKGLFQRILQIQKSILQCFVHSYPPGGFYRGRVLPGGFPYRGRPVYVDEDRQSVRSLRHAEYPDELRVSGIDIPGSAKQEHTYSGRFVQKPLRSPKALFERGHCILGHYGCCHTGTEKQ